MFCLLLMMDDVKCDWQATDMMWSKSDLETTVVDGRRSWRMRKGTYDRIQKIIGQNVLPG